MDSCKKTLTKSGVLAFLNPAFDQELTLQVIAPTLQINQATCQLSDGTVFISVQLVRMARQDVERGLVQQFDIVRLHRQGWSVALRQKGTYQISKWLLVKKHKKSIGIPVSISQFSKKLIREPGINLFEPVYSQDEIQHKAQQQFTVKQVLAMKHLSDIQVHGTITKKSRVYLGKSKLFFIEIEDKEKSRIQCVFFDEMCDQYSSLLNVGKSYIFKGVEVKRKRSNQNQNELVIRKKTKISLDLKKPIESKDISSLQELSSSQFYSFLGVILKKKQFSKVTQATVLTEAGLRLEVLLWPEFKQIQKAVCNQVLLFQNFKARIKDNETQLSSNFRSNISFQHQTSATFPPLSSFTVTSPSPVQLPQQLTIAEIKTLRSKQLVYAQAVINIQFDQGYRSYFMVKCKCGAKHDYREAACSSCNLPIQQMKVIPLFKAEIIDHTDSMSVYFNNEVCQQILGKSCLQALKGYLMNEKSVEDKLQCLDGDQRGLLIRVNPHQNKTYFNLVEMMEIDYSKE